MSKTVAEAVEKVVKGKPFLENTLADGLINMTSLARKILPEVESELNKEINPGAVVMAIKRLAPTLEFQINHKVRDVISNLGDITIRSKLGDYTFKNSGSLTSSQTNFLKEMTQANDLFYTVSRGVNETTFVISEKYSELFLDHFRNEKLIASKKDLSSLTISLPEENYKLAGIYYYIFRDLAWAGINILEVISTTNEFTLVVDDKNVEKAFRMIKWIGK